MTWFGMYYSGRLTSANAIRVRRRDSVTRPDVGEHRAPPRWMFWPLGAKQRGASRNSTPESGSVQARSAKKLWDNEKAPPNPMGLVLCFGCARSGGEPPQ